VSVSAKFGTVAVTSNQAQATVPQIIPVLTPDVVSMMQSAASAVIASAGLTVGTVSSAPSSIVVSGGVASQTPGAGTSVPSGRVTNSPSFEELEPHRTTHLVVAAGAGMNAVSAVERRRDQIAVLWILHHLVEVDDGIKRRLGADPLIHLVA
jgi:hypothetical protein